MSFSTSAGCSVSDDKRRAAAETAAILRRARQAAIDEGRAAPTAPKLTEYGPLGNATTEDELLDGYLGLRRKRWQPEPEAPDEGKEGTK